MPTTTSEITRLLHRWGEGDPDAFDRLVPIVYDRLRQLARQRLRGDPGATLNTTGLVHEAYLKLAAAPQANVRDRGHFLALASRVMRNLLADHARWQFTTTISFDGCASSIESTPRPSGSAAQPNALVDSIQTAHA